VRAIRRGYEEAVSDPQAGVDILLKGTREEVDEAIERPGADLLVPMWKAGAGRFGDQDSGRWDSFTRWMQETGLLGGDVRAADAFTNRFGADD
jgi:ABC-type nitrate/sulfonate/bicarbonate transport system substrate-binding protein